MINISSNLIEKIAIKIYESISEEPWDKLATKYRQQYFDLAYDVAEICWDNLEDYDDEEATDLWEDYDDEEDW